MSSELLKKLADETAAAQKRVYDVGQPTPLETVNYKGIQLFLKREDLSPIHAYKWRGAYNRMAQLTDEERRRGVICASAGNHAQGVAVGARRLGIKAKIFMPTATPDMKREAVARHGGDAVEIILHGNNYNEAAAYSRDVATKENLTYVHAFDDFHTIAGQGTLALEIIASGHAPFDVAFVQIGGGGMAAGVAAALKAAYPDIKIIGVEGTDQASMKAAFDAGKPVQLEYTDGFCDGTAVNKAGENTYPICRAVLDEIVTVTNDEVCAAMAWLWEHRRAIPEPAGAMGIAAMLQRTDALRGKKVIAIVCGANMDFSQLGWVSRHAGLGSHRRHYVRFTLDEQSGALLDIVDRYFNEISITDFQYGKTNADKGYPVIAADAAPERFAELMARLQQDGITAEDVSSEIDMEFRVIHYDPKTFMHPLFYRVEFPERKFALRDFLRQITGTANICYFNYAYTGESIGRALMGFEFKDAAQQKKFRDILKTMMIKTEELPAEVIARIL